MTNLAARIQGLPVLGSPAHFLSEIAEVMLVSMTNDTLSNRIAVVTGASSGIGEAAALALAARGAKVAALARRKDRLDALVGRIKAQGGQALAVTVDIADGPAVQKAAAAVAAELGQVDLVVNNAGLMLPAPIDERRRDDWARMIDINVNGVLHVIDAFVQPLVAAAAKGAADLVNISSVAASAVFPSFAVYCATKAAVTHLSKNLRTDLGPKGVRVSVIEPGLVTTELQGHVTDPGANAWLSAARTQLKWLDPADIAETIAFTTSLPRHVNLQQVTIVPTQQV
jgi:NADP-dependent 3-hydroxy acid dehydrogenase YdfG